MGTVTAKLEPNCRAGCHRIAVAAVVARLLIATFALLPVAACKPAAAPASQVMKSIEERRARAVIEQVLRRQGDSAGRGRTIKLPGEATLAEEFSLGTKPYGIAYLTVEEASKVGDSIPAYNPDSQQLRLVRGQDKEVVLVLYEQAYKYDAGSAHSTTAVTAERKLQRDVEDFMMHVVRQGKNE